MVESIHQREHPERARESIRQNEHIKGIPLPGTREVALAFLYADDITYFNLNLLSLFHLFSTFSKFEAAIGERVKPAKTKAPFRKEYPH